MDNRFPVDSFVRRREILHGRVWLSTPVRVVADDDVLAVWLAEGTPLTFPPHPFGAHPWSGNDRWSGTSVLQLHRAGDAHAVWGFFHARRLDHWYINFQAPYRRTDAGFDTVDHGIDIVIDTNGWQWKDRDDVAGQIASGRLTANEADLVWAEADRVASALNRGERWWLPRWAHWQPT
jgi:hypothetical protein